MKMTSLFLTEEQHKLLKMLGGASIAEHIRRAIDEYIKKNKPTVTSVSASLSPSTSVSAPKSPSSSVREHVLPQRHHQVGR